jgi:opacity protein-like surface antigen
MSGDLLGINRDTKGIFMGNHLRVCYGLSVLLFDNPLQYGLSLIYDFGKKMNGREVFGRYLIGSVRYSRPFFPIRDARWYVGAGPALINIVKVDADGDHGDVLFGLHASCGLEVQLVRGMFLDLGSELLQRIPNEAVDGFIGGGIPSTGRFFNVGVTFGIGYRF